LPYSCVSRRRFGTRQSELSIPLDLISIAIQFAIVLVSLTIHEAAHAWTADRRGDPTARMLGRVSLNPLVHIDPIGTVVLPLLSAFSNLVILGWAKPVPVNVSRLRNGRRDFMAVAAAGPISNLLQAVAAAVVLRIVGDPYAPGIWDSILAAYVSTNILLAFFNLLPIPPLDGGNVLAGLLPPAAANVFVTVRQYGFIILYALILTGVLWTIIGPPTRLAERILLP
jgi:Zn-dependent protease